MKARLREALFYLPLKGGLLTLRVINKLEQRLLRDKPLQFSPTFIVSPPRSGSTFISQLLINSLDVSYFPNFAVKLFEQGASNIPLAFLSRIEALLGTATGEQQHFGNRYGVASKSRGGGSDTERVWRHILGDNLRGISLEGHPFLRDERLAYRTVSSVERCFSRPFIDKTVTHLGYIQVLNEVFPNALFIRLERNPLATAQSIYIGLQENEIGMEHSYYRAACTSAPGVQDDPMELTCRVLKTMQDDIDAQLSALPQRRVLDLGYEKVCFDPQEQIDNVIAWMNDNGAPTRQVRQLASGGADQNIRKIDPHVYEQLKEAVERIFGVQVAHLRSS